MSESVACRGCGRRVRLPDGINIRKARCPKCRARLDSSTEETPDPFRVFAEATGTLPVVAPPPPPPPPPAGEILSLDDEPAAAPLPEPPPPFRFRARIRADSRNELPSSAPVVLTPHGLFLEAAPNQPILFAPVGTRAEAVGALLVLTLPDRAIVLHIRKVGQPNRLAADTAAFLANRRSVPLPADYRRPWWLLGVAVILAAGLAVGPVMFADAASLGTQWGLTIGGAFAAGTFLMNAGIIAFTRYRVAGKVALMTATAVAVLAVFLFGAGAFLIGRRQHVEADLRQPPGHAAELSPAAAPEPPPDASPPAATERRGPPTYFDLIDRDGHFRLEDGPADVTALAVDPANGATIVGYADGNTRICPFDQDSFEPPRPGPRGKGAVRRIEFDPVGKMVFLSCDGGLTATSTDGPLRAPVLIPGEMITVRLEPNRERFAALRGGRVQVRYVPLALVKDPPFARLANGFVTTTPKDEVLPIATRPDLTPPGGKPTFLAWHPTGRLLCGEPGGSIATLPAGGGPRAAAPAVREHKSAVRAWAESARDGFVTGDEGGFVGYWPLTATKPMLFRTGAAPVRHLAFGPRGELAVADDAGMLSVWEPATGTRMFEVKRRSLGAVAYGPRDDLLMLGDGKAVEVWWLPALSDTVGR